MIESLRCYGTDQGPRPLWLLEDCTDMYIYFLHVLRNHFVNDLRIGQAPRSQTDSSCPPRCADDRPVSSHVVLRISECLHFQGRFSTHRTPRSSLSSCRQKLSAAWSTSWPPRPQRAPAPLYLPAVARAILCMHASGLQMLGSGISSPWTREILTIRVGFPRAKLQRMLCEFSPHRLAPAASLQTPTCRSCGTDPTVP